MLVQVSPACAFISGKFIQICGADGEIKTISIAEAGAAAAFLLALESGEPEEHPEMEKQCGLCFAAQNIKAVSASSGHVETLTLTLSDMKLRAREGVHVSSFTVTGYFAQGPPTFFV